MTEPRDLELMAIEKAVKALETLPEYSRYGKSSQRARARALRYLAWRILGAEWKVN